MKNVISKIKDAWKKIGGFITGLFRRKRKPCDSYILVNDQMNPNATVYTIRVKNNDAENAHDVRLFGSLKDLFDKEMNPNISVEVFGTSHQELKLDLLSSEIFIKGLKMSVKKQNQFTNGWKIRRVYTDGHELGETFLPNTLRSTIDIITTMVQDLDFELKLDKHSQIEFSVNPSEEISIWLFVQKRIDFEGGKIVIRERKDALK